MAELEVKLRKVTKRPKVVVAVPVSVLGRQFVEDKYRQGRWASGYSVQHVTLTGIDANGDVRYVDDRTKEKGRLDKLAGWGGMRLTRRLTEDEVNTFTRLAKTAADATEALHTFEATVKLKGRVEEAVKAALAAKIDTPEEPPEDSEDPR